MDRMEGKPVLALLVDVPDLDTLADDGLSNGVVLGGEVVAG